MEVAILELRRDKAAAFKELRALLDMGELTPEQDTRCDELEKAIEGLDRRIQREERSGQIEESLRAETPRRGAEAPEAPESTGFRSLGEFLQSVAAAAHPENRRVDERLYETRAASGANETVPSEGGFLVQKDMAQTLIDKTYNSSVLASRCQRISISGNSNGLKMYGIDETSRADGSRWGGFRVYSAQEADTVTATKTKFKTIELNLHKVMGLSYITDELLQDAGALEAIVMSKFPMEMAFWLDDKILNGTGVGVPLGILNAACLVSVSGETGQTATTIVAENVIKMRSRLWVPSRSRAAWYINQDCEPQLFTMGIAVGTGGIPVYMPANGLSAAPYDRMFGASVIPIEQCATMGTVGDILYLDLGEYILIDKGGVQSAASMHVRFLYDEMTYRFTYRVDGQPAWSSALTPYKGSSNTVSPFVALATRS